MILALFFSLSGFLVTASLQRCKSLISFLGLRVLRIGPALAVETTLSAIIIGSIFTELPLAQYVADPKLHAYFLNIVGDIQYELPGVFLHNPMPDVVNAQLWTVPYELWCYVVLALLAVLAGRWLRSLDPVADFIATYDGHPVLPEGTPEGMPWWMGWQHFLNMFLMVLIIRTGLTVRREKRPTVFWSPRSNPARKISLTLWFHQSLDILWLVNGVVFVVLLFATGQWMRIVPTSWDVFPNAVSAGLQYLSLDWPDENGWVYYNALQELSYFVTVFVAAPLAIASGFRMSGMWPKAWSKVPVGWARAVHFPTMVYFLIFIAVHVFLVATTGLRGNLNAMFAARDDASGWLGLILFLLAVAVTAAGWWAARPSVVTPVAQATGKVTRH